MYAWRIIYGIGVEIGVRDVLIFDEYKKRNEIPILDKIVRWSETRFLSLIII